MLFGPKAPFGANDTCFCLSAFLHILLFCETRMKTKRRHCPTQRRHSPTKKRHLPTTFWQDFEAALLKETGSFWSKRHNIYSFFSKRQKKCTPGGSRYVYTHTHEGVSVLRRPPKMVVLLVVSLQPLQQRYPPKRTHPLLPIYIYTNVIH